MTKGRRNQLGIKNLDLVMQVYYNYPDEPIDEEKQVCCKTFEILIMLVEEQEALEEYELECENETP